MTPPDAFMIIAGFRLRLQPEAVASYMALALHIGTFAKNLPGYISHKGFVAEDGYPA